MPGKNSGNRALSIGTLPLYNGNASDMTQMFMAIGYDKEFMQVDVDTYKLSVEDFLRLIMDNYPTATFNQRGLVQLAKIEESEITYDPNTGDPITKWKLINPSNYSDFWIPNAQEVIAALSRCVREGDDIDGEKVNILLQELHSTVGLDSYLKERELAAVIINDEATGTWSGSLVYRLVGNDNNGSPRFMTFASASDMTSVQSQIEEVQGRMNHLELELDNKVSKSGDHMSGTLTFDVPTVNSSGSETFANRDHIAFNSNDASVPESVLLGTGVQLKRSGLTGKWTLCVDNIIVRNSMYVPTLIIDETRHIQGSLILSPGHGKITQIEEEGEDREYWRLYLDQDVVINADGTKTYTNASSTSFDDGDFIRCSQSKYGQILKSYWEPLVSVDQDTGSILVEKSRFDPQVGIPEVGDEIVVFGNSTNSKRWNLIAISASETQSPLTATYTHINQNTNACLAAGLVEARGNIEGIVTPDGETLHGIGTYIKGNARIYARLYQTSGDGTTTSVVACFKGEFDLLETYYVGDEFTYLGEHWRFIGDASHQYIRGVIPTDETLGYLFMKIVKKGESGQSAYYIEVLSSHGNMFKNGIVNTTLTAIVRCGVEDISSLFSPSEIRWTRTSSRVGDASADLDWNFTDPVLRTHRHTGFTLQLGPSDVTYKATFDVVAVDDPEIESGITNYILRNLS